MVVLLEFIRKIQYNDNGLRSMDTSRIEKAKHNTHGTYNDDERFTCTRNKCSAVVQYNYTSVVPEHN